VQRGLQRHRRLRARTAAADRGPGAGAGLQRQRAGALDDSAPARTQAALPGVRLQWSALDGSFTEAQAALDAVLLLAQGPWPRGWQVRELAPERVGVVVALASGRAAPAACAASALLQETLLHTSSRPQAWPAWAQAHDLDTSKLQLAPPSSTCTTCWRQR
jgi:hypothetical protein